MVALRNDRPVVVRGVHANVGVETWYRGELERLIRAMRDDVVRHVLAAFSRAAPIRELAMDAPRSSSLFIRDALRKWGDLWVSKFDALSLDMAQKFASKSFGVTQTQIKTAFREAGFTVKFAPTPASVAAYHAVAAEQVNLIKSIPSQFLKDVETKVWASVQRGGDLHSLSTDLHQTYNVTKRRAALIARDQNNKAKAVIERVRDQELGVTHAIWQHSSGGKVPRATHIRMDGKPYEIAKGMYDSDEQRYVLPGELINCRCISNPVIPAFDDVETATANTLATRPTKLYEAAKARSRFRRKPVE